MTRRRTAQAGVALILVLWMVTLIALLAGSFLAATRTEGLAVRHRIDAAQARATADGGVEWAVFQILSGAPVPADGQPISVDLPGGTAEIRIQDTRGLFDVNQTPLPVLRQILLALGVAEGDAGPLAARLVDYRDPDQDVTGPGGLEDPGYARLGLAHDGKDAPVTLLAELSQIPGFGRILVGRLAEVISVANRTPGIDPAVAPVAVRQILARLAAADLRLPDGPSARPPGRGTFRITVTARHPSGGVFRRRARVRLTPEAARPFLIEHWDQLVPQE